MGLLMDTYEDNLELTGLRESARLLADAAPVRLFRPTGIQECPACFAEYTSEDALKSHLFREHAVSRFYVRLDGRVASELELVEHWPSALEIVAFGSDPVTVSVLLPSGQRFQRTVAGGETLDVLHRFDLGAAPTGELQITGRVTNIARSYSLYFRELPPLEVTSLDDLIATAQEPLLEGDEARWRDVHQESLSPVRSTLERRYLSGFAEYLYGCNLELQQDWRDSGPRFERAFGLLRVFSSDLARVTWAIVAFKMNAFRLLLTYGRSSFFWEAAHFFQSPMQRPAQGTSVRVPGAGIWIDEFQEGVLRAIHAYWRGDFARADSELRSLPTQLAEEPNNNTKQLVLTARISEALGDEARRLWAYRQLLHHPDFGAEAERALG